MFNLIGDCISIKFSCYVAYFYIVVVNVVCASILF